MADDAGSLVLRLDACLLQVAANKVAHDASPAECSMRRIATEEHLARGRVWPPAANVCDDRFPDLAGEREVERPPLFRTTEADGLATPVDVLESERGYFARADAIGQEECQNCSVAKATGRLRICKPWQPTQSLPW